MTLPPARTMRVTIPLRYRDLDTLGHLNQSVYHTMLEEARMGFIRTALSERSGFFVLARVELDHRHEVRMGDREVHVDTHVDRVGASSIRMVSRMTVPSGALAAEAISVMVAWDPEARGARALTESERESLLTAQGGAPA